MPRAFTKSGPSARFFAASVAFSCLLACAAFAQQPSTPEQTKVTDQHDLLVNMQSYNTAPGTGVVVLTVYDGRKTTHLDRQALLKLISEADQSYTWQTTESTSKGVFTNIPY